MQIFNKKTDAFAGMTAWALYYSFERRILAIPKFSVFIKNFTGNRLF